MQPDSIEEEIEDLPDDFYELTVDEVRRLYHDLQQHRISLENTPLVSSTKQKELEDQVNIKILFFNLLPKKEERLKSVPQAQNKI